MRKRITAKEEIPVIRTPIAESKNRSGGKILVVDDHRNARDSMAEILHGIGHRVIACASGPEALSVCENQTFECVLSDLQMPGMDGLELIREMNVRGIRSRIIMLTGHASVGTAVEAIRLGAFDYLEKPCEMDRLERLVDQAIRHYRNDDSICETKSSIPSLIGSGPAITNLKREIERIARSNETVLITGESGTGKEVIARSIHSIGPRTNNPFVTLNCPALSLQLMESELFGHEKGAFTGAEQQRIGRFEKAVTGTLLLDEITEIGIELQAKLLRVLQERSFERVGSSETLPCDVRVIATSNRDIRAEIANGRFREDLYYRLSVLPLRVPPLRERKEDIPELIEHFIQKHSRGNTVCEEIDSRFDKSALRLISEYDWPGNVRQLENVVIRSGVLSENEKVTSEDLRRWLCLEESGHGKNETENLCVLEGKIDGSSGIVRMEPPQHFENFFGSFAFPEGITLEEMERMLIEETFRRCKGHRGKTAETLKIGVRTLNGKLREYGYAPREKVR